MIAIIKYNAGNTASVKNAFDRLGCESKITDNHEDISNADKVVFPGVGEAGSAMQYLRKTNLHKLIPTLKQPVLGICLGLQLMCVSSEEGNTECLGIFDVEVKRFPDDDIVPHIGWNNMKTTESALFSDILPDSDFYYVHGYYAAPCIETIAVCNYITPFSSVLNKGNFYATQFHPEKSAQAGERLLKNFLKM